MRLRRIPDLVEGFTWLDGPGDAVAGLVRSVLSPGPLKDLLSGTWLGHPLHPVLTDLPIGFWTSSFCLDLVPSESTRAASDTLLALGVVSALPTALAGLSDYGDTMDGDRRVGTAHAIANSVALGLYTASLLARRRGHRGTGVALSFAASGVVTAGAWLGGHLAFGLGIGVDQTAFETQPEDWADVAAADDVVEGRMTTVRAGDATVLLTRHGGRLVALDDRCTHRGGPLHDGELRGDCVRCPWHASEFRLRDGEVERGPATLPQPAYGIQEVAGRVRIRLRPAAEVAARS